MAAESGLIFVKVLRFYRLRVIELFTENKGRYGYRRIHALLKRENIIVSEKVIRRIMKEEQRSICG